MLVVDRDINFNSLNTYNRVVVRSRIVCNVTTKKLIVLESGSIQGEVVADEIILHGELRGSAICHGTFWISSTASFEGNLSYGQISISKGAAIYAKKINKSIREIQGYTGLLQLEAEP